MFAPERILLGFEQFGFVFVAHMRTQIIGAFEATFALRALERTLHRVTHFHVTFEYRLEREHHPAQLARHALRIRVLLDVALETAAAAQFAAEMTHAVGSFRPGGRGTLRVVEPNVFVITGSKTKRFAARVAHCNGVFFFDFGLRDFRIFYRLPCYVPYGDGSGGNSLVRF